MAANPNATNMEEDTEFQQIADEDGQMTDINQPLMDETSFSQEDLELAFAETEAVFRSDLYEAESEPYSATALEAQIRAEQEHSIIHSNNPCYWQCHICGYHNNLSPTVRDFWRAFPSVLDMQTACLNPSDSITRSNNTNSGSRIFPNDIMCGHDRCGWCIDLDEQGRAVRFCSGQALSAEQYEAFWGWRYWAELNGVPEGHVTWEQFRDCCVLFFGGVPTLQPLDVEAEVPEGVGAGVGGGQALGGGDGGGSGSGSGVEPEPEVEDA